MDNKTMLLVLMLVLIAFIVLLTVLGVVFIVALRKRAPVVKVVMAPLTQVEPKPQIGTPREVVEIGTTTQELPSDCEHEPEMESESVPEPEMDLEEEESEPDEPVIITEGQERVRYDRSFTAKIAQVKNETKEWYSELKNELLSYKKIKDRMSWKRESFRLGRMTVARLVVRGKTLCLMLAAEPAGYAGTKYHVEDVSDVASTADTPTFFRIRSARRLKYAKEMIAGIMQELKVDKIPDYEAQDYYVPYEGNVALMQRGLIKRVVSNTTSVFKIEEVTPPRFAKAEVAATTASQESEADDTLRNE